MVVVFATQWSSEGMDIPPWPADGQDALIAAVAAANPKTVVVLETGGPVLMPWRDQVGAVLEAWYPGAGAARRSPASFSARWSLRAACRPPSRARKRNCPGPPKARRPSACPSHTPFDVTYAEGAAVGYRWFDQQPSTRCSRSASA